MRNSLSSPAPGPGTRFLSWLPALALMAAIFWLSDIPGDELPLPDFRFSDKLAHFCAYAVLGASIGLRKRLHLLLRGENRPDGLAAGGTAPVLDLKGAVIGILYGMSDEIHQLFVPLRMFSLGDIAADALGVAAGIGLVRLSERRTALGRLADPP